jgi:hypothetical protein
MMTVAMGQELWRQVRQVGGYVRKVGNSDSEHNPSRRHYFLIIESEAKTAWNAIETNEQLVFKFRHHSISEGKPVGREGFKAHWQPELGILDPPLGTKLL